MVTSPCHAGDTPPLYSTIYIDKLLSVSLDSLRVKVSASVPFASILFPIMGIAIKQFQTFLRFSYWQSFYSSDKVHTALNVPPRTRSCTAAGLND